MAIEKNQIALGFLQLIGLLFPFLLGILRLYISENKKPNPPDINDSDINIHIVAPNAVQWIIIAILVLLLAAAAAASHLLLQLWPASALLSLAVILLFIAFITLGIVALRILLDYFSTISV